jgi:hypothetical protein
MRRRRHFGLLDVFMLLGALCALGQADDLGLTAPKGHLRFEATVGALRLEANSLTTGMKPDDTISIKLPGDIVREALDVQPVARADAHAETLEAATAADYSAFRSGDETWIAANFTKAEAPDVLANFSDRMIAGRARDLFNTYKQKKIVGRVVYKDYQILIINYGDWPAHLHAEHYVKEGADWKRTNALASDETYDIVAAEILSGKVLPEP